ncbi:hypothetical protein BC749_103214 [Flavobacterium araucananum]|nr:hypothetical protein BC749_103214 [Flavobacterium araucananum]
MSFISKNLLWYNKKPTFVCSYLNGLDNNPLKINRYEKKLQI